MYFFADNHWINLDHVRRVQKVTRRNDDIKTELRIFQDSHLPPISVVSEDEVRRLTEALEGKPKVAPDKKPS